MRDEGGKRFILLPSSFILGLVATRARTARGTTARTTAAATAQRAHVAAIAVTERHHFGDLARGAVAATLGASSRIVNLFDRTAQFKVCLAIRTDVFVCGHSLLPQVSVSILLGFARLRN